VVDPHDVVLVNAILLEKYSLPVVGCVTACIDVEDW
jgi:hypothetical protein